MPEPTANQHNAPTGHVAVGHPVDVASGAVFTVAQDFFLPGSVPLDWRRRYATDSPTDSWLGRGWALPYFMTLEAVPEGLRLLDEGGSHITFPAPEVGLAVGASHTSLGANMTLTRYEHHFVILHWHHGTDDVERFVFQAAHGRTMPLAWIENVAGHRIVVEHDAKGRPAAVMQEVEGRRVLLAYDAAGLLASVEMALPDGDRRLLCTYEYDERGRMVGAADAAGAQSRYAYDEHDRMVCETNPLGSSFRFRYDAHDRCIYTSGDDRYMERHLAYRATPPMTSVIDSLGHRTEYHLNAAGQVIQELSPLGWPTTTAFDEHGRVVGVQDAAGHTTSFAYDDQGNRSRVTLADGSTWKFQHDAQHLLVRTTDPMGGTWSCRRDDKGSIVSYTDPLSRTVRYERDELGFLVAEISPAGQRTTHRRGPTMQWAESADEVSLLARQEFDALGNQVASYDAQGLRVNAWFDVMNRPVKVMDRVGRVHEYEWNAIGELTARRGPDIGWETREYDRVGQLVRHANPLGELLLRYDTEGQLVAVKNRAGEVLQRLYDADGRLVAERGFDGRTERCEYNGRGEPTRVIRPDGREIRFSFGPCGELLERDCSDGLHETFAYDARGSMIAARTPDFAITLERDALDRVVAEEQNGVRIEFLHDEAGFRCGRVIADVGALNWRNDSRGRLTQLADARGPWQQLHWDTLDRLVERRFEHGTEQFLHDDAGRLVQQSVTFHNDLRSQRNYRYNAMDLPVRREDYRNGATDFQTDAIGRLVGTRSKALNESFAYDANGAILATHRGARTMAPGGRTLADGQRSFEYDPNGCIATITEADDTARLAYDVDGRITRIDRADGSVVRYSYDALGRRIAKTVDERRTDFVWDGACLAAEMQDGHCARQVFFHALEPLAVWSGEQRLIPINDLSGAVREVVDETGRFRWRCVLDSLGAVLHEEGDMRVPFRFRGQYADAESGFSYNFHRSYDPRLGDFLSPDPIGLDGGTNFYAYPRNPLVWDDPFGLKCPGHKAEAKMDKHFQGKGYSKISVKGKDLRANGIDGIYYKKGGSPEYIIAEAKAGSAALRWSVKDPVTGKKTVQQLSDKWINSGPGGSSKSRLESALPPTTDPKTGKEVPNPHLEGIQNAAKGNNVDKVVYTPSNGEVANKKYGGDNSSTPTF